MNDIAQETLARAAAGEPLLRVFKIPCLRALNQATIWRWCQAGRVPALRLGRDWFAVASLVNARFAQDNATQGDLKAAGSASHEKAMASLRARGLLDAPKGRKLKRKN